MVMASGGIPSRNSKHKKRAVKAVQLGGAALARTSWIPKTPILGATPIILYLKSIVETSKSVIFSYFRIFNKDLFPALFSFPVSCTVYIFVPHREAKNSCKFKCSSCFKYQI